MKKALVIGGGFAGCAAAHQLMLLGGWDVTLVERAPFLGAGNKTHFMGGHPYTFGPRHFLTQREELFDFLNKYVPMARCADHQFVTYVEADKQFYNYPVHFDDVARMPEKDKIYQEIADAKAIIAKDQELLTLNPNTRDLQGPGGAADFEEFWVRSIGRTLYDKFINVYSKKMWMLDDNRQLDDFAWSPKGVALKEGAREAWDTAISAYPIALNGYDNYFEISTEGVSVHLSTSVEKYDIPNKTVYFNGEKHSYDVIVNTISPDILFDNCFGELPYIGRDIEFMILPVKQALPDNVYFSYYAGSEKYTRIVEYKKFTKYESDHTLISLEYPSKNGKYYPVPFKSEMAKAQKYFDLMPEGVFSIGRAGSYRYHVDIDDLIGQAFDIADALKS